MAGIIAYENGDLDEDATIELFQHLVNDGTVWHLQGHYVRLAIALIDDGIITNPYKPEEATE